MSPHLISNRLLRAALASWLLAHLPAMGFAGRPEETAAPSPGSSSAPVAGRYELRETGLERSPEGRKLLAYLISCALPHGVMGYLSLDGETYEFPGSIGLAPAWLEGSLSLAEERWLSACLLARTNYFGEQIRISLRAPGLSNAALMARAQEREEYSLFEGGFFGNLFAEGAPAYACLGERTARENADPILKRRICAEAAGRAPVEGKKISACNFIHTGPCADPGSYRVGGETYSEVLYVYLKPDNDGI